MGFIRQAGGFLALAALTAAPALADPVTVTDMTGRTITLEKPAERIIVFPVPWSSTVIALDSGTKKLIALHPESKLAIEEGVLGQFFPGARDIPSDIVAGGASKGFMPNVEAVAALKPDLVIQWGNRKDDGVTPLANAGINTAAIVYGAEENARQIMTVIANAMGHADKLSMLMKWRDDTARILNDKLAGLADADRPKVAYFFYTTPEYQTEGKGSYMD
jgi:iron complex transport system substrate-binding protein